MVNQWNHFFSTSIKLDLHSRILYLHDIPNWKILAGWTSKPISKLKKSSILRQIQRWSLLQKHASSRLAFHVFRVSKLRKIQAFQNAQEKLFIKTSTSSQFAVLAAAADQALIAASRWRHRVDEGNGQEIPGGHGQASVDG